MNSCPPGRRPWTPIPTGSSSTSASTDMSCTLDTTLQWRPCSVTWAPRRSPVWVGALVPGRLLAEASPPGRVTPAAFLEEAHRPSVLSVIKGVWWRGKGCLLLQNNRGRTRCRPAHPVVLLGRGVGAKARGSWSSHLLLDSGWTEGDWGSTLPGAERHAPSSLEVTSPRTLGSAEAEDSGHPVTDFKKLCWQWPLSVEVWCHCSQACRRLFVKVPG